MGNSTLFDPPASTNGEQGYFDEETIRSRAPTVLQMLSRAEIDGVPRQLSYLTFSLGQGGWLIRLSDPQHRRSVTLDCEGLIHGLECLEQLSEARGINWFYWGGKASSSKKGK